LADRDGPHQSLLNKALSSGKDVTGTDPVRPTLLDWSVDLGGLWTYSASASWRMAEADPITRLHVC